MFEIHVGELRATFLRNHNMRRHKDPSRRHPKPGRQLKHRRPPQPRQPPQARGHCTRYVAVHPNRRGALPTDRVQCPNTQEQTRNWHTEPLTAAPLHAQLGPTGGRMGTPPTPPPAPRPTPTHSDTSYTLTCEEPVNLRAGGPERHLTGRRRDLWERTRPPMPQHLEMPPPTCSV